MHLGSASLTARRMPGSLMMNWSMDCTLRAASIGTRAAPSMFTTRSVDESRPCIFMNAIAMRGMNEAVLEPNSRPTMSLGLVTFAPGVSENTQYGGLWEVNATHFTPGAAP